MSRRNRYRRRSRRGRRILLLLILIVLVGYGIFAYTRPVAALYPISNFSPADDVQPELTWPNAVESAIGAAQYGVLATHGNQSERPTASVAKLITALTVLNKYPLVPGQQGPTITITQADVNIYAKYLDEDGSTAKVVYGEQISEYQALEAMLLPSANNVADALAIWAYGSLPAYSAAANQYIKTIGLDDTTVGADASGFLPSTTSSASDLVKLGLKALQNPVLAQIVSETQATVPVAGTVPNVNWLLGNDGIFGIKTGNTNQAGGVYVFAAKAGVADNSQNVTIVGAIEGAKTLQDALDDAIPLLNSAKTQFQLTVVVQAGQAVATYNLPWGDKIQAVAATNVVALTWPGRAPRPSLSLRAINAPLPANASVGSISITGTSGTTPVKLASPATTPPWWWRIIRHDIHV